MDELFTLMEFCQANKISHQVLVKDWGEFFKNNPLKVKEIYDQAQDYAASKKNPPLKKLLDAYLSKQTAFNWLRAQSKPKRTSRKLLEAIYSRPFRWPEDKEFYELKKINAPEKAKKPEEVTAVVEKPIRDDLQFRFVVEEEEVAAVAVEEVAVAVAVEGVAVAVEGVAAVAVELFPEALEVKSIPLAANKSALKGLLDDDLFAVVSVKLEDNGVDVAGLITDLLLEKAGLPKEVAKQIRHYKYDISTIERILENHYTP